MPTYSSAPDHNLFPGYGPRKPLLYSFKHPVDIANGPLNPPAHLGREKRWTYHSKLTNDARELFLYTFTSRPGTYAVVKRVDEREALIHSRYAAGNNRNNNYPQIIPLRTCAVAAACSPTTTTTTTTKTTDAYLVLEHARGGTLEDLLARLRSLVPAAARRFSFNKPADPRSVGPQQGSRKLPGWICYHVLAGVLDAVIRMHTRDGVMHIDLHLQNIVFQKQEKPPEQPLPNPDEIPLEQEEDLEAKQPLFSRSSAAEEQQQDRETWAVPVVKIIDFGRVHELPPEGGDTRSQWESQPSPCVGLLARRMLGQGDVYGGGGGGFVAFLQPLARSQVSIGVLQEARSVAMVRKEENVCVPQWLREYFQ